MYKRQVNTQIQSLKAQLQRSAKPVTVAASGLFSAVVDGYETTLTPAMLDTLTPSQLSAVTADSSQTSNVGKLVLGDTWYYAANMSEEAAAAYKVGHTVTLRFVKELNRDLTMTVQRVSDSENGQKLVVFSSDEYLPEVTLLRRSSASLIHDSYSGIRVPTEALREMCIRDRSCTIWLAIFWAVSNVARMESSVARYSSTFSTSTFSLAFSAAFSLYRVV